MYKLSTYPKYWSTYFWFVICLHDSVIMISTHFFNLVRNSLVSFWSRSNHLYLQHSSITLNERFMWIPMICDAKSISPCGNCNSDTKFSLFILWSLPTQLSAITTIFGLKQKVLRMQCMVDLTILLSFWVWNYFTRNLLQQYRFQSFFRNDIIT